MRDSLHSRFRGAFLGGLLGEAIGVYALSHQPSRLAWQQIFQGRLGKLSSANPNRAIKLMFAQTAALVGTDQLSAKSTATQTESNDSIYTPNDPTPEELILSTLPLALFYHDQPVLYRTALQTSGQPTATNKTASSITAAALIGQAISLILRERFVRLELIPQLLKDLDLEEACPDLANQLHQIQTWVEQSTDLAGVARHVNHIKQGSAGSAVDSACLAVALALYGFLCTPDDFRLSLLRASQLDSSILLPTLTGTLSGLYNGVTGLPNAWRQQVWLGEAEALQRWGVASEAEVEEFADRLLAGWAGATDPIVWLQQPQFNRITAAPRAIRAD